MADTSLQQHVESAVTEVLESNIAHLREQLVGRVMQELADQSAPGETEAVGLLRAVTAIHAGNTQREILRALLDSAAHYCGRCALFVVKGGAATGWQGRGFANNDAVKDVALDLKSESAARTMQERAAISGSTSGMDAHFLEQAGHPANDHILLLPRPLA